MIRIAGGSLILAVLGLLCALALPRGLADLRAFEARMLFQAWETARRQPSAGEWTLAAPYSPGCRAACASSAA